jgi:23S rRNA pseudouridine1911/1915/1917 synthase
MKMAVDFNSEKEAVTTYHVVERFRDSTLLELALQTGRTHQIRVHMSHIGHPLLGDDKYGTRGEFPRPMLHAKLLGFTHPATKKYMEFTSPLPADMRKLIKMKRSEM